MVSDIRKSDRVAGIIHGESQDGIECQNENHIGCRRVEHGKRKEDVVEAGQAADHDEILIGEQFARHVASVGKEPPVQPQYKGHAQSPRQHNRVGIAASQSD